MAAIKSRVPTEIDFKARWWHDRQIKKKKILGLHHPDFHTSNPMVVPPPLRDDGKTRCGNCDLSMAEYELLNDGQRRDVFNLAADSINCDLAWKEHK